MRSALPLASALFVGGCATTAGVDAREPRTAGGFPTAEVLAEIATAPKPSVQPDIPIVEPDAWALAAPFPKTYALTAHAGDEPWDALLAEQVKPTGGSAVPSSAMHCVARATAAFYNEHLGYPSLGARNYAQARCRAVPVAVQLQSLSGEVPDTVSDEALFAQWRDDIEELVGPLEAGVNLSVGLAFARSGGRATFVVARGERRVWLESVRVAGGAAVVKGRLLVPDSQIRGLVNQGRFAVAGCDNRARAPQFDLRCPLDPEDAYAWLQIGSFPPGRFLGKSAAELLVGPGEIPSTFRRRTFAGTEVEISPTRLVEQLVTAVNRTRAEAKMPPLSLEGTQSAQANQLAPHFFTARLGQGEPEVAETIYLGLRAGWDVDGAVRYGLVTSGLSVGTSNLGHLVGNLLESPSGRETLLDPALRRIAVGSVVEPTHDLVAVLVSSYALFGEDDPTALGARVFDRLNQTRAEAGLPPAERIDALGGAGVRTQALLDAGRNPDEVLRGLLKAGTRTLQVGVQGYRLETNDLSVLELPPQIVTKEGLRTFLAVAWYQPPDEPWGRYVAFFVYPAGNGGAI